MKRSAAWIIAGTLFSAVVHAQSFTEGVHYRLIEPAQPTNDASKVEVVEIFSYACPACANFEPHIKQWSEDVADDVILERIPVVFRASWEPFARAYFVADALGILEQSHDALFDALHGEGMSLRTDDDIAEFFADRFGVSEDEYRRAAKSFAIQTRLNRGTVQSQRYGVESTPSIVINGKYITTPRMAGSADNALALVEFLIEKERAAMVPASASEEAVTEADADS